MNPQAKALATILVALGVGAFLPAFAKPMGDLSINAREELDLPTPGAAVAVAFSPDGSTLAAASDYGGVLTTWDRSGRMIKQFRRAGGGPTLWGYLSFVRGNSQLVFPPPDGVENSSSFSVWDVLTGTLVRTVNGPQPGDDYPLNRAQYFSTSPSQGILVAATGAGKGATHFQNNIAIYDTTSWLILRTLRIDPGIASLCLFADGRLVGVGSTLTGHVFVLDATTGAVVSDFYAFKEINASRESNEGLISLGAIAGSPNGDLILVGVRDATQIRVQPAAKEAAWESSIDPVRILRVKDGSISASLSAPKVPIRKAVWDPKGRYLAFIDNDAGLYLWSPWTAAGYKRIELPSKSLSLAVAPDGDRIAVTLDRGVRVYTVF